jgi:hypothetical protein
MSNDKEITYLLGKFFVIMLLVGCVHVWRKKCYQSFTSLTMCMCHPINIPLEVSLKFFQEDSPITPEDNTYGLDFLFTTCWEYETCYCIFQPCYFYIVCSLVQHFANLGAMYWEVTKWFLWYIKKTTSIGIKFNKTPIVMCFIAIRMLTRLMINMKYI